MRSVQYVYPEVATLSQSETVLISYSELRAASDPGSAAPRLPANCPSNAARFHGQLACGTVVLAW